MAEFPHDFVHDGCRDWRPAASCASRPSRCSAKPAQDEFIPLQRLREMAFLDGLRDRYGIPGLQHGGIVRSPTLALVGELVPKPDSVVPDGRNQPRRDSVILEVDGRALAEVSVPNLPGAVSRLGLGF